MKKLIISMVLVFSWTASQAQALWTSASADFDIANNLGGYIEGEYRTNDGLSSTNRWSVEGGLTYKFCPYFKIGASYTFIRQHVDSRTTKKGNIVDSYWQPRNRFAFDATGSYKLGKLKLSLRERYQFTHHTEQTVAKYDGDDGSRKSDEVVEAKDKHILRSRLKAEYNISKSIFTPFASVEMYNSLSDGFSTKKLRYTIGTDISIAKHHDLSLYYRYVDNHDDDDDLSLNVIGVGYKFSF